MKSQINYKNWTNLFKLLILFCLIVLLYNNTLLNKPSTDDHALIFGNYLTQNLKFLFNVFKLPIFRSGYFYQPLSQIFFMIEYSLFKMNIFSYHFINILIHFINCILFFKIINFLFNNYNLSLLSTSLFAIHPIHNTIINQAIGVAVFLVNMVMLFSLISFIKFSQNNNYKFYFLSIIFFVVALFMRETATLLPFYLICLIFFYSKSFKKYIYLVLPFIICDFGYFLFRTFFFNFKELILNEYTASIKFLNYIFGYIYLLLLYLSSMIIPKGIVWIWSIPKDVEFFDVKIVIFILIFLVAIIYMAIRYWKKGVESFAILWFLIGALPTISMISRRSDFGLTMEPHWLYFSSIGFFLFMSIFLLKLKKYINTKLWISLVFSILLFYTSEMRAYNYLWKNPETYYKYWLSKFPNNIARMNLANIYSADGKYKEAESLYIETLNHSFFRKKEDKFLYCSVNLSDLFINLGNLYYDQGDIKKALAMFSKAIEINPHNSKAYLNRAVLFLRDKRLNEAITEYEKAAESDPYCLDAHYNLTLLYTMLDNQNKALEEYFKAITIDKNCFKRIIKQ